VAETGIKSATETARGTVERVEPTKAQRAVARRVAESKATAPHLYLETEVRADTAAPELVVHACAQALREFPRLNGAYRDGAFETYSRINIGVAVAGTDAPVVVTVFDADRKTTGEIADELAGLSERATAGKLTSPELAGGTFTVAGAAVGAIRAIAAVLNQGQAGTLAFGPVTERAIARDGAVTAGRALTATLSCDARMIGVDEAAGFLERVRALLEEGEGGGR
jgi:pyruvate dehydrogenase E2 component (dihydrolipoamide acetyltransferase)